MACGNVRAAMLAPQRRLLHQALEPLRPLHGPVLAVERPQADLLAVRVEAADLPKDAVLGVPFPQADALAPVRPAARLQLPVAEVELPGAVPLAVEVAADAVGGAVGEVGPDDGAEALLRDGG